MDYQAALEWLDTLPNLERDPGHAPAMDLRRMRELLAGLGHPEESLPIIHIAGTKGKGSTAAMLSSMLNAVEMNVGLYTSPHLHTVRERIRVNERLISRPTFASNLTRVRAVVEALNATGLTPTYFEALTALALYGFARARVDCAVLETGLGGRLDATNVVWPVTSVLTPISLDHTQVLGDTLAGIAWEKAGIIKHRGLAIVAPQPAEALVAISAACAVREARLLPVAGDYVWDSPPIWRVAGRRSAVQPFTLQTPYRRYTLETPLLGEHQLVNAATAVAAAESLGLRGVDVDADAVRYGLASVRWPGRLEVTGGRPLIVLDGAHNGASVLALQRALGRHFEWERLFVILGSLADKDLGTITRVLGSAADIVICTRPNQPRAADPEALAEIVRQVNQNVDVAPTVAEAIAHARRLASPRDLICVTGSLYVVAEARAALGLPGSRMD